MKDRLSEEQERFLELLPLKAMNVSECCRNIGISRDLYYKWVRNNDTFSKKRDEIQESLYDFVESKIYQEIKEGNTTMIIFFAKTKMRQRGYVETKIIETASPEPMVINFLEQKPKGAVIITESDN